MRIARYEFEGIARYGMVDPESGKIREIAAGDPFDRVEATGAERLPRDLADLTALRVGQTVPRPALEFVPRDPHFPNPRTSAMS